MPKHFARPLKTDAATTLQFLPLYFSISFQVGLLAFYDDNETIHLLCNFIYVPLWIRCVTSNVQTATVGWWRVLMTFVIKSLFSSKEGDCKFFWHYLHAISRNFNSFESVQWQCMRDRKGGLYSVRFLSVSHFAYSQGIQPEGWVGGWGGPRPGMESWNEFIYQNHSRFRWFR